MNVQWIGFEGPSNLSGKGWGGGGVNAVENGYKSCPFQIHCLKSIVLPTVADHLVLKEKMVDSLHYSPFCSQGF